MAGSGFDSSITSRVARMMRAEKFFREIEATWDAQRRLTDCDHHHVDVQVLSTVPVMFPTGRPRTPSICLGCSATT